MPVDILIKWKNGKEWVDFLIGDILHLPRNHAIDLFSRNIPMIARQGDIVVSNDSATMQQYHKIAARDGLTVMDLAKLERSEMNLSEVGFLTAKQPLI